MYALSYFFNGDYVHVIAQSTHIYVDIFVAKIMCKSQTTIIRSEV